MLDNSHPPNKQTDQVAWRCPSNIAIVKYWGKRGIQIPANPSVSMTLSRSFTEIAFELFEKEAKSGIMLDYYFEKKKNPLFADRIRKYLDGLSGRFPLLNDYGIKISSHNSFPHSAGIASSASAFGAIAVSLLDTASLSDHCPLDKAFFQKASALARLGSGSACRSMYPEFTLWGENKAIARSSNEYAVPLLGIHENFKRMNDAILIVEDRPKEIASSKGHALMNHHCYAKSRFAQANEHAVRIIKVLENGDYDEFIKISESEALALHAMMMTSEHYYLLMKPGTLIAIEKIMAFRKETKVPICFTLDAGPNVHVLYPDTVQGKVESFINDDLKKSLKGIIFDQIGAGPEKVKFHLLRRWL